MKYLLDKLKTFGVNAVILNNVLFIVDGHGSLLIANDVVKHLKGN